MDPDAELVLFLGGVHIVGIAFAAALLWHFVRAEPAQAWSLPEDDDDDGGGGNLPPEPPVPTHPRGGGIPLPDAVPARVRLREPGRLADLLPEPARRPAHTPAPARTPERV
jgi:hypothetical protein